jgi:hypothetical protein
MDRDDLSFQEWIIHMKQELMDAILYLEKLEKLYGEKIKATDTERDKE